MPMRRKPYLGKNIKKLDKFCDQRAGLATVILVLHLGEVIDVQEGCIKECRSTQFDVKNIFSFF